MRHQLYNPTFKFVKEPEEFDKYTEREMLQYCLGATMYMPGMKDFTKAILTKKNPGLTTMVMCFEDAIKEGEVEQAEENAIHFLNVINENLKNGVIEYKDLPLIIFRTRTPEQFKHFGAMLKQEHIHLITAFNFPKFSSENGIEYYTYLKELNEKFNEIIYGMPILESREIAHKETRMDELIKIKEILDRFRELVLNIRVGGTDFSSCFGVRRGINYTIYDIMTVRDCLQDILNVFTRDNEYCVSGPVWEYFRASKEMKFEELPETDFHETLLKHETIINDAIDGLLRETILDKANGFIGKTIIHPTHIQYVNGMLAVTREEYEDALQIMGTSGGVIKSANANKMNEIGPHRRWAEKLIMRAKAYGVIEDEGSYLRLFV